MIKRIFSTVATKGLIAIINFLVIILTSRYLGVEARGTISLIALAISINAMISEIVGGPALIYLIPRAGVKSLVFPAYFWAILSAVLCSFLLQSLHLIPAGYFWHIVVLSMLFGIGTSNLMFLIGTERIYEFNIAQIAQFSTLIISLLYWLLVQEKLAVDAWVNSMVASYIVLAILSFAFVGRELGLKSIGREHLITLLRNGIYTQTASLAHVLGNRINFYILGSVALVGLYSNGLAITEGALMLSGSASLVLLSYTSNATDLAKARRITLVLGKVCFALVVPFMVVICLLPESFYQWLFGTDFGMVRWVIVALSSGIVALSYSTLISHYFSGVGKHYVNTIGSLVSLGITLALAVILVPGYGVIGAGIAASVAFISSGIFLVVVFLRHAELPLRAALPSRGDWIQAKQELAKLIKSRS